MDRDFHGDLGILGREITGYLPLLMNGQSGERKPGFERRMGDVVAVTLRAETTWLAVSDSSEDGIVLCIGHGTDGVSWAGTGANSESHVGVFYEGGEVT